MIIILVICYTKKEIILSIRAGSVKMKKVKKSKRIIYNFVKRLFDLLVSIIGVLILLIITPFIKLAFILTGDFNTIFYSQERIGKKRKNI